MKLFLDEQVQSDLEIIDQQPLVCYRSTCSRETKHDKGLFTIEILRMRINQVLQITAGELIHAGWTDKRHVCWQ